MPQDPRTSLPRTHSRTGIVAYCPTIDVPSRAIQISGSRPGLFGLRRYCQSQRIRLPSAASLPNTRRYNPSTERLSSVLYRVMSATLRPREYVFHVADERILGQGAVPEPLPDRGGHPADRRRRMQFLADDAQPGRRNLASQPNDSDLFERVVVLVPPPPCRLDKGVLVGRLTQRPRRVPRELLERRECKPSSEKEVQWYWYLQPRQVCARKREVRRGREVNVPAGREHPRTFAKIERRVGNMLDDGVRKHEVEGP